MKANLVADRYRARLCSRASKPRAKLAGSEGRYAFALNERSLPVSYSKLLLLKRFIAYV